MPLVPPVAKPRSAVRGVLVPLLASLALLFGLVSPAHAVSTGTVTGQVVGSDGSAVTSGAYVALETYDPDGYWTFRFGTYIDDGSYRFDNVPAGTYRIKYGDWDTESPYLSGQTPSFGVEGSGTTVAPDLRLEIGGKVTGTVTRVGEAAPGGVLVSVLARMRDDDYVYWGTVRSTRVQSGKSYTVQGLESGTYRLAFSDESAPRTHLTQYWPGAADVELAESFTVTQGQTTAGKNATLVPGGTITGTVKADTDGAKISGLYVYAYERTTDGDAVHWAARGYHAVTDESGTYSISGLPTGTYHVEFQDFGYRGDDDASFDTEFYQNAYTQQTATDVQVVAGTTVSGKNASLARRGSLSGTVTSAVDGAPVVTDVRLYKAYDAGDDEPWWSSVDVTRTDSRGQYTFNNVASGTYRLEFRDVDGRHITEYFDNATNLSQGTDIVVAPSAKVTGKNVSLALGGSISGTVSGPGGSSPQVCVSVFQEERNGAGTRYQKIGNAGRTTASGAYSVRGLATGNYKVRFAGCGTDKNLATEYWLDAATLATATPIAVTAGVEVPDKNVVMAPAASISGTVTGAGSESADRRVNVVDANTGAMVKNTYLDDDGTYSVTGLTAGSYKVEFARLSGVATSAAGFFENIAEQLGLGKAKPVTLAAGGTATNVNASLVSGGHITGRLVDRAGKPLSDYQVHAYTDDRSLVTRAAYTNDAGRFDIGGLTTGSYEVVANLGKRGDLGRGYYAGLTKLSGDSSAATPVAATIGGTKVLPGDLVLDVVDPGVPPVVVPPVVVPPVVAPPVLGPPAPAPQAPRPVVKKNPSIKITAKGGKKKATLTITVKAAGSTPTGKITIKLGSKTLKSVTLKNGRAKIVLTKQKKGKRAYKVVYGGDSKVKNKSASSKKIAIK